MNLVSQVFAGLAALLHILIFCMESLWFMKPKVHRRFGARTVEDAESKRLFAFNQGFYNLFLAVGVVVGLALMNGDSETAGTTLVVFGCSCMIGAGVVLIVSAGRQMLRAGTIQAFFPALALVLWLIVN